VGHGSEQVPGKGPRQRVVSTDWERGGHEAVIMGVSSRLERLCCKDRCSATARKEEVD
jgi:hypothetical protein